MSNLSDNIKSLREKQLRGTHVHAIDYKTTEKHVCQNCGIIYRGRFCPNCGQSCDIQRFDYHDIPRTLFDIILNANNTFWHTIIELLYRPGYMIRDYFDGHRCEYVRPVKLLGILVAILMFEQFVLLGGDNYSLYPFVEEILKSFDINTDLLAGSIVEKILSNIVAEKLFEVLLTTIPFWFTFRKTEVGRRTNITETCYLNIYSECLITISLFFDCLLVRFFGDSSTLDLINLITCEIITIVIIHQYYQLNWIKAIIKNIQYVIYCIIIFMSIAALVAIGAMIIALIAI